MSDNHNRGIGDGDIVAALDERDRLRAQVAKLDDDLQHERVKRDSANACCSDAPHSDVCCNDEDTGCRTCLYAKNTELLVKLETMHGLLSFAELERDVLMKVVHHAREFLRLAPISPYNMFMPSNTMAAEADSLRESLKEWEKNWGEDVRF